MRMIACRAPLTAGTLSVENLDVRRHARRIRSLIGVVPQENNLDPDLSVRENLLVYARYFRPRARKPSAGRTNFGSPANLMTKKCFLKACSTMSNSWSQPDLAYQFLKAWV